MRKKSFQEYRNGDIPSDATGSIIEMKKREREAELIRETKYFRNHGAERDFLFWSTFDITSKDFEYFTEYIMKEYFKLKEHRVTEGPSGRGEDIIGEDEKGQKYSFQCKQWASPKITPDVIGEYLGQTYEKRKTHSDTEFVFVTTGYLTKKARDFLRENGVICIHNVDLVRISKKLGFLKEEKWNKLKHAISVARLKHNRGNFVTTPLSRLREQRREEMLNHFQTERA